MHTHCPQSSQTVPFCLQGRSHKPRKHREGQPVHPLPGCHQTRRLHLLSSSAFLFCLWIDSCQHVLIYQVPTTYQAPSCPLYTLPRLRRRWAAHNRNPTKQCNKIKTCVPPQQEGSVVSQGPRLFLPHCPQHMAFALRDISWLRAVKSLEWHLSLPHLTGHHPIRVLHSFQHSGSGQLLIAFFSMYLTQAGPPLAWDLDWTHCLRTGQRPEHCVPDARWPPETGAFCQLTAVIS